MIDDVCILTIGDFSALRGLQEHWSTLGHDLAPALRRKLHSAKVVFPSDLPRITATLGSCISYAIDDDEEILSHTLTATSGVDRRWLPVGLPLGLALLGQHEGATMIVPCGGDTLQRVKLHRVVDQPEASWPGRFNTAAADECAHQERAAFDFIDRPVAQASRQSYVYEDSPHHDQPR